MSELADTITDAVDKNQHDGGRMNAIIAVSVAITATFMALCNVKDGNIVQAMQQAQASAVDEWSSYQAKGTKLNIVESARDALELQRDLGANLAPEGRALLDRKLAEYQQKATHFEAEKAEIKGKAEGLQREYDRLNLRDDQFDMAEATTSIAIALFGITALTQKRGLLFVAWAFAGMGVVLGVSGFSGLSFHPDFLAKFLS